MREPSTHAFYATSEPVFCNPKTTSQHAESLGLCSFQDVRRLQTLCIVLAIFLWITTCSWEVEASTPCAITTTPIPLHSKEAPSPGRTSLAWVKDFFELSCGVHSDVLVPCIVLKVSLAQNSTQQQTPGLNKPHSSHNHISTRLHNANLMG